MSVTAGNTKLFHWGDSELTNLLRRPSLNGILQFFFGDFQPTPKWFKDKVDTELFNLGDKYIPQLHTNTNIDFQLHTLIGDAEFISAARFKLTELGKGYSELRILAQRCTATVDKDFAVELVAIGELLRSFCGVLDTTIRDITHFLSVPIQPRHPKTSTSISKTNNALHDLWKSLTAQWRPIQEAESKIEIQEAENPEKQRFRDLQSLQSRIWGLLDGVIPGNLNWFRNEVLVLEGRIVHLIGGAGAGKTHVLAKMCSAPDVSGIFLRGISFSNIGTIQAQILQQLDLNLTWKEFLSALSIYATSYGRRVLIAIDALNEAGDISLWANHLRSFEEDLKRYSGIALVTSCRPSYVKPIWGDSEKIPFLDVTGFNSLEVKKAIAKYFEYFQISASLTLTTLEAFKHPLYLSIFCQATNRDRTEVKQVFLGQQSLFRVFEQYLDAANISFSRRIDRPPEEKFLHTLLRQFAKHLWEKKSRGLPQQEARVVFDGGTQIPWSISTTKALLNEDLILSRSFHQDDEQYEFTYDLLGGHLVAEEALATLPENFAALSEDDAANAIKIMLAPLVDEDFASRHPLHSDILRAIAAILPARTGKHLLYLTKNGAAFTAGVEGLFEMDSQYVSVREAKAIQILFEIPQNRDLLFSLLRNTAFVPGHALNASLFSQLLGSLSMVERDLYWSEHVRFHMSEMRELISEFLQMMESCFRSPDHKGQLRLAALFLMWILTSTGRFLRDATTRALVIFGSRYPRALFNLRKLHLYPMIHMCPSGCSLLRMGPL